MAQPSPSSTPSCFGCRCCCCNVRHHTKTLAKASAPALAMNGLEGWKVTSCIDSSNFLRWEVISWTQVLLSRFHSRIEQSWPETMQNNHHHHYSPCNLLTDTITSFIRNHQKQKLIRRFKHTAILYACRLIFRIRISI